MNNTRIRTLVASALAVGVFAASSLAQAAGQTIIVDGVRYQAVGSAPVVTPVASPAIVPTAAPVVAAQYGIQPAVVQPASVAVQPDPYAQQQYSAGQVIVPLVVTALGVWAVNNWFRDGRVGHKPHQGHHGHQRPVGYGLVPTAPVVVVPTHGGHRH